MYDSGGLWAWMWIAMIAMWALFATLVFVLYAALRRDRGRDEGEENLARLLARGEIDGAEYKSAIDALRSRKQGLAYRILHGK